MRRADFHYELPASLIAQAPLSGRSDSRLLCLDSSGDCADRLISQLPGLLAPGDLLVFNDTRVLPARLRGQKQSGGQIELLIERHICAHEVLAWVRASKSPRPGGLLRVAGVRVEVLAREAELFRLRFEHPVLPLLESHGEVPLPPYIRRDTEAADRERYQTVYAQSAGAIAAPTAGLHFTPEILARLPHAFVTLHVGAGTFQPVKAERLEDHVMHRERYEIPSSTADAVAAAQRVIAVGTTSMRTLEASAREHGAAAAGAGSTDIFIFPGCEFRVCGALLTNFHLPKSTLLMLVSAFAGRELIREAYAEAVRERYRLFSYGDCMLIL